MRPNGSRGCVICTRRYEKSTSTRFISLKDPVVVSGEETKRLDSVLLLVSTDDPVGGSVKKGSGTLLIKTRLSALENSIGSESDGKLFFNNCVTLIHCLHWMR